MKIDSSFNPIRPIDAAPEPPKRNEQLWKVSKDFESIFVSQMIQTMRSTVKSGGLVEQGQGEKIFQSMLDDKFAGNIADSEQIGLSQLIYQQLLHTLQGG